jgi:hypothetical protein
MFIRPSLKARSAIHKPVSGFQETKRNRHDSQEEKEIQNEVHRVGCRVSNGNRE